jgi:hypothetical protein
MLHGSLLCVSWSLDLLFLFGKGGQTWVARVCSSGPLENTLSIPNVATALPITLHFAGRVSAWGAGLQYLGAFFGKKRGYGGGVM